MEDRYRRNRGTMVRQRGFTLIEMAMVLVVIGLIVGGGIVAIGPLTEQAHRTTTNTSLDQIETALVLFAIRNNRLPCPADGSQPSTSATYGAESGQTGTGAAASCSVAITNSVIPWKTLSLDISYSLDGWGNRISYFPANASITGVSSLVWNDPGPTFTGHGTPNDNCLQRNTTSSQNRATGTVCDSTDVYTADPNTYPFANYIAIYSVGPTDCATELTVPNTGVAGAAYTGVDTCASVASPPAPVTATNAPMVTPYDGQRAAYVLVSHGKSGGCAWTQGGAQINTIGGACASAGTPQILKKYNNNGSAGTALNLGFVQGTAQGNYSLAPANFFDDIVRWRSPSFILQNCGSGACGNP